MRLRFTIITITLLALSAINGYNQQVKMWLDSTNYDQDNVFTSLNATDTVVTYIHATDSANTPIAVTGNIAYWVRSDSMIQLGLPPVLIDNNPSFENISASGFMDSLLIPLNNLVLRTGPGNVIIIWPVIYNPSYNLIDSGFTTITVYVSLSGSNIETEYSQFGSTVFPNPSQGIQMLYIQSKHTQPIQHVEIINMIGQPVFTKVYSENEAGSDYMLPLAPYQSGVYYLHIYYTDGKHETVKFIKN